MDHPIITIIGPVDNGKSTLLGNLLLQTRSVAKSLILKARDVCRKEGIGFEPAYLVDYIREERELKSTKEWALAELKVGRNKVQIIDTPGQRILSPKMISGLTQANIAIIILDIAEKNFLDYKYYFNLVSFLDFSRVIVVVNKMDLVDYRKKEYDFFLKRLKKEVRFPRSFSVLPVSAIRGENLVRKSRKIPWYRGECLVGVLRKIIKSGDAKRDRDFLMPVQDCFDQGQGRVVMGKVLNGRLRAGERSTVVCGDRSYPAIFERFFHLDRETKGVKEGENVGLFLQSKEPISRGCFVSASPRGFECRRLLHVRANIMKEFRVDGGFRLRYFRGVIAVKNLHARRVFNSQFVAVKGVGRDEISAQSYADLEMMLSSPLLLPNKRGRRIIPEARRIVLEDAAGTMVALGIITSVR